MNEITYDRRYGTLTPEVEAKLILSQQEAANAPKSFLTCPICGYRINEIYRNDKPLIQVKCRKCKFEGAINVAYFRSMRSKYRTTHLYCRKKRQVR